MGPQTDPTETTELWNRMRATPDRAWFIEQEGFEPSRERELETIFSIGNGYLGARGALLTPIPTSQADLFIAGIYAQKMSVFPYSEVEFKTQDRLENRFAELVPFPSPFRMLIYVDGKAIDPERATLTHFERTLDMKRGILHEIYRFTDESGRTTKILSCRATSLEDPHLLFHDLEIIAENHSERIDVDFDYVTSDFPLLHPHLKILPTQPRDEISDLQVFETKGSKYRVAIAGRTLLNGEPEHRPHLRVATKKGDPVQIRRLMSVFTSRDGESPEAKVLDHALGKKWGDFQHIWGRIEPEWDRFWEIADIQFDGRPDLTQAQRFNSYHLRIAASEDPKTSVAARTLTGRSYEGHVFWDSEIFAMPFFLYSQPHIARSLLLYRYNTLEGARKRAREMGQKGASFAWESTVTGEDVTPKKIIVEGSSGIVPIFTGTQQIHVTADIAHAVAKYWHATEDHEFIRDFGAELLFETARFWAHRVTARDHKFHIDEVVGPDEYHHSVNDNAYTNWMARENLRQALWCHDWFSRRYPAEMERLVDRLDLERVELERWRQVADEIHVPGPDQHGIIEQFEGYFDLKDVPVSPGERLKAPISRLLRWKEINETKLIKQADMLMIPFLFPNALPSEVVKACFEYYEPRTEHGSSLSPSVHAAIAAQIGLKQKAEDYWHTGLNLDLFDTMDNSALGFHAACAGGSWQALVFHMCHITDAGEELRVQTNPRDPILPSDCRSIQLSLIYRGRLQRFEVKGKAP